MSLSVCSTTVDASGRELLAHGSLFFPVACYHDDLSQNEVPWHWHEELEAAVVTKGCCMVAAGSQKYTLHPGEGFFINSGILHGAWAIDSAACRFHSVVFHPRLVSGSIDSIFHQNYVSPLIHSTALASLFLSPHISWQKRMLDAIEVAWQACVREAEGYEFEVRHQLSMSLLHLHSHLTAYTVNVDEHSMRNHIRIKQMLQFIHENYAGELTVDTIARAASLSNSECMRCFKSTIGTTPIRYLRQYRLSRACQLLASATDSIGEIASRCGFHDLSYFTKIFRESKGLTPGEYRLANHPCGQRAGTKVPAVPWSTHCRPACAPASPHWAAQQPHGF